MRIKNVLKQHICSICRCNFPIDITYCSVCYHGQFYDPRSDIASQVFLENYYSNLDNKSDEFFFEKGCQELFLIKYDFSQYVIISDIEWDEFMRHNVNVQILVELVESLSINQQYNWKTQGF